MTTFHVPDMSCGHCKAAIEKALHALDPNAAVRVDLSARTVSVETPQTEASILAALKGAGYEATRA
ncbi:heavy-metal-associated domain-containing protein [Halovulum dunhuangense]|uniref:Heavy-metal-associated domain-containing protein n=1 Tax=Halovulum dunhuangense TaxID=1505036 RepID=A0A849L2H2_9RHOB|nr:heavy-metal-associated domain-containing protein [Halovulum dunhuangense]NNU80463.1 heavy-metal-associated domain-containing protein [Halovulum dunhuangense]